MNISGNEKYVGLIKRQHFRYYLAAFISLITFIVYLKSLQNEFVNWDDITYVVNNPYIRSLNPAFFRWAFLDFYASYWSPLTWISHAIDYALWGLNPLGHHLTNIILHAVNTFVVVLLVVKLLEAAAKASDFSGKSGTLPDDLRKRPDFPVSFLNERATLITGGVTGLLFGLHPLHVESVAWVAERKDLLCALFFLLSIMMYMKYINPPIILLDKGSREEGVKGARRKWYILCLGFFILALLSKPMVVTLPLVLLILDWYPFKRIESLKSGRDAFIEKAPFLVLSLVSVILTILAAKPGGAMASMEVIPFSTRALVATKSLVVYLWKMIVPLDLMPFYAYPEDLSLLSAEYMLPITLVVGITIGSVVLVKKQRLWLSSWLYYVVTLIPVLGIVQVGSQSMADRFTYLPSLGPFLVMGLMIGWVSTKVDSLTKWRGMVKFFIAAMAFTAFFTMAYLTFEQIGVWENTFELWNFVIKRAPKKSALSYYRRGLEFHRMGELDKAIADYDTAIALDPFHYEPFYNRGAALSLIGQYERAIKDFDVTIALNPSDSEVYVNRGAVFSDMGRLDRAITDYSKAIVLNPNDAFAYWKRGNAYLKSAKSRQAVLDFQKVCSSGREEGCEAVQNLLKK